MSLLLSALPAALKLATLVAKMVHDQKLMDAGEARAIVAGLEDMEDRIERAKTRAAALDHGPDSVRDDDANRDDDGN